MVWVLFADGFEEMEAIAPIDILRRAGAECLAVGVTGREVKSARGITLRTDALIEEVRPEGLKMLVLPGGARGTENLSKSSAVRELIAYADKKGLIIGAICAAPSILGGMGLLKGRKATVYPGMEETLKGAQPCRVPVCRDGNYITASGAGSSIAFALELAGALFGPDKAEKIARDIVCGARA